MNFCRSSPLRWWTASSWARLGEVVWLQPFPDALLEGAIGGPPGPEARYEQTESISLAFVTALQVLPPRQVAVLILRDVLGCRASEVAGMLDSTVESANGALKRARASLQRRWPPAAGPEPPPAGSPALAETRPDTQPPSAEVDTAGKLAECERRLVQYRAALDAGASPATVAAWIAETEAEKESYALRSPERRPRMTQQEIKFIVTSSQTWPEY